MTLNLADVLRKRMARPDTRCGPPVDLWGAALRPFDVHKQPEDDSVPWHRALVILGTGEVWR